MNTTRRDELFKKAASRVAEERQPNYKMLPGDADKGTLYKGFVRKVEMKVVENPKSQNLGRELLVITTQVKDKDGEFHGWEETFNRVLQPASLDEPYGDNLEAQVKELIDEKGDLSEAEAKREVIKDWEERVLRYYEYTLRQFEFIGVDTASKDEAEILKNAAHATNAPAVWRIYDKTPKKSRRAFLEDSRRYFKSGKAKVPNLFEELPSGDDIPFA